MEAATAPKIRRVKGISFFNYIQSELRRGYLLENDEERYAARREKVYTFFKIPREIEKFLAYGFFQSADSFLFVLTFLPIRFILAIWCLITRSLRHLIGLRSNMTRLLKPAEIVDILKGTLLIICCYLISFIDTSVCYHIIKTQSTIKLYLFFNMLEIADRLMSAFGQDTLDALFWTATEPRDRKREHFGVIFHLMVASIYVAVHSTIVLLQALTLNVAINSDNKGLLTIVISNNFVELKGAVFKKFDRNNLLQISCSDVRERFHICVLLFVVVIQTMKEYAWKEERLWILLPDCFLIFGTEVMIDWLKHAFITRFNDIPIDAYRDYTLLIASDLIMCKQKYAYSDHSDLVARRMGFIPIPLGVVIYRVMSQSLHFSNVTAYIIFVIGFLCLLTFRILNGIIILGKACDLINNADIQRSRNASESVEKPCKNVQNVSGNDATPLRTRRRTKSKEIEHKIENVHWSSQNEKILTMSQSLPCDLQSNSFAVKDTSEGQQDCDGNVSDAMNFKELSLSLDNVSNTNSLPNETEATSLGFLGDSQSGLMANSMVNLASVGLNQGVTDHNSSISTITQSLSPDEYCKQADESPSEFTLIEAPKSYFEFKNVSSEFSLHNNLLSKKAITVSFEEPSVYLQAASPPANPHTMTQSCPSFNEFCSTDMSSLSSLDMSVEERKLSQECCSSPNLLSIVSSKEDIADINGPDIILRETLPPGLLVQRKRNLNNFKLVEN